MPDNSYIKHLAPPPVGGKKDAVALAIGEETLNAETEVQISVEILRIIGILVYSQIIMIKQCI